MNGDERGERIARESERIDRAAIRKEGWLLALRKYFAGSRVAGFRIPVWEPKKERENQPPG